jgi:hypothetical protein
MIEVKGVTGWDNAKLRAKANCQLATADLDSRLVVDRYFRYPDELRFCRRATLPSKISAAGHY